MYITYNPLPPIQGCSVKLCIHALLQADGSYPSEHHKPPTHLQFYCPIKSVELSWAQFDYMVCEEVWWSLREIWALNFFIKVQTSNHSTNNDMLRLWNKIGKGHSSLAVVLHLEKVLGSTPSIDKLSWCCFLLIPDFIHRWRCFISIIFPKEIHLTIHFEDLVPSSSLSSALVLRWIDPHC